MTSGSIRFTYDCLLCIHYNTLYKPIYLLFLIFWQLQVYPHFQRHNLYYEIFSAHHCSMTMCRQLSLIKIVPYQTFSAFSGTILHVEATRLQSSCLAPIHIKISVTKLLKSKKKTPIYLYKPKVSSFWWYFTRLNPRSIFHTSVIFPPFMASLSTQHPSYWNFLLKLFISLTYRRTIWTVIN